MLDVTSFGSQSTWLSDEIITFFLDEEEFRLLTGDLAYELAKLLGSLHKISTGLLKVINCINLMSTLSWEVNRRSCPLRVAHALVEIRRLYLDHKEDFYLGLKELRKLLTNVLPPPPCAIPCQPLTPRELDDVIALEIPPPLRVFGWDLVEPHVQVVASYIASASGFTLRSGVHSFSDDPKVSYKSPFFRLERLEPSRGSKTSARLSNLSKPETLVCYLKEKHLNVHSAMDRLQEPYYGVFRDMDQLRDLFPAIIGSEHFLAYVRVGLGGDALWSEGLPATVLLAEHAASMSSLRRHSEWDIAPGVYSNFSSIETLLGPFQEWALVEDAPPCYKTAVGKESMGKFKRVLAKFTKVWACSER